MFVEDLFDVFREDSVANSRAISMNEDKVNTKSEIKSLFDPIAYGKVTIQKNCFLIVLLTSYLKY